MITAPPPRTPVRVWLVELFAAGNLGFLSVDIYLAHQANHFARTAEWVPVVFSATVVWLLVPGLITRRIRGGVRGYAGLLVGIASVIMGVTGFLFHLEGSFLQTQTLKSVVYAAPFIAPLSYAGVGLLLILNRLESEDAGGWGLWVVFLALCGFVGNLGLSLADHAQNGFFVPTEWTAVFAAAFAIGFLGVALFRTGDRAFLAVCLGVMVLQAAVGVLGFVLHARADLHGLGDTLWDNLIYGAPIFAPLLFTNLAILASIGLWEILNVRSPDRLSAAHAPVGDPA